MTVHVIGAGLAGLSCALAAADAGFEVVVHEGAGQAGGRCRSWVEPKIGKLIDNGTHMVVGGNHEVFRYLRRIGSVDTLQAGPTAFPMLDLESGETWTATPARLLPSLLASTWRLRRGERANVAQCLDKSRYFRRFWDPLTVAIMNTPPEAAAARVFRRVLARTLWRGQAASQPFLARNGLSETFVRPALTALGNAGATVRLRHPLRRLERKGGRIAELEFDDQTIHLGRKDAVVLALPWVIARNFLPSLPDFPASPIVNAHFRLSVAPAHMPDGAFLGLLGGTGQWLFLRDGVLSITVSAAADLAERSVEEVSALLWADAVKALQLQGSPAATRIIKEKRATLFHTPEVEALRPPARAGENLFLAGDWTATGLPCTIEGALTSGRHAAYQLGATLNGGETAITLSVNDSSKVL